MIKILKRAVFMKSENRILILSRVDVILARRSRVQQTRSGLKIGRSTGDSVGLGESPNWQKHACATAQALLADLNSNSN